MADEEIILSVSFDPEKSLDRMAEVIKKQNELREANKAYIKDAKEGNNVTAERTKEYIANVAELAKLKNEQKLLTAELGQSKQGFSDYGDSLDEMRRKLSDMQKAYDAMDATIREGASGQAFKAQMQEQYDAVLKLEEETGRHQRNVGNYPKIVTAIIPGFEKLNSVFASFGVSLNDIATNTGNMTSAMGNMANGATSATSAMASGFKNAVAGVKAFGTALITPPIAVVVAVLSAILLVVNKVTEAIKKNDNAGTNLAKAFAVLQPIISAVGKAFDIFAEALTEVILAMSKIVEYVAGGILAIVGLGDAYSESAEQARELVQAQDDLEERERTFTVNSAKWQRDISELRAKVAEKDKYSVKERREMLLQAIELEKKQLEEERAIAKERLRILQETAKQANDTSDEMKNKISQLTAEVYRAEQKFYEGTRGLQKQVSKFDDEINREVEQRRAEAQRKAQERQRKAQEQARKRADEAKKRAEESAKIEEEYTLKMLNLIQDSTQKQLAISTYQYEKDKEILQGRMAMWKEGSKEYSELQQLLLQLDKDYDTEQEQILANAQKHREDEQAKREADVAKQFASEQAQREQKRDRELQWAEEDAQLNYERTELELEREIERLSALEELNEEHKAMLFKSEDEYQAKVEETERNITRLTKQAIDERKANTFATLSAVGDVLGGLTQMMEAFGSKNKALAIASKTIALAQILINQGLAVAKGIAQAQSVPFPANIGAIATTISAIMAGITSAVSAVKSAKFASGGIVGGSDFYGDRVPAYLNSGEMVLNRAQQKQLFEIANSRIATQQLNYNRLAEILTNAVAQLPPPVLDYSEFTDFQQQTTTIKQLTTL